MFDKRRIGPVRQLSLQTDVSSRPILKKQLSVEHLDTIEDRYSKLDKRDRPKPIRVAWAENGIHLDVAKKLPEPVEARKCKEHKRPTTAKARTQYSAEKESILYTRQELAERLRKAWKEREQSKQNLDIFLTHHVEDKTTDDDYDEDFTYEVPDKSDDYKVDAFFNKKATKPKSDSTESGYVPTSTVSKPANARMNISVTIPSTHTLKSAVGPDAAETKTEEESEKETRCEQAAPRIVRQNSIGVEPEAPKPPAQRPQTASAKREGFQKRSNAAFTSSLNATKEFRPPLTRTLSVPTKQEPIKAKFFGNKRRLKPARRKERDDLSDDELHDDKAKGKNKKNVRCRSAPGGELVTMVSLVSPAGSDSEEVLEKKESKAKPTKGSNVEIPQNMSLRKTVKTVSFQQSSIHAVRSFSASYSFRRGSMATAAAALGTGARLPPGAPGGPEREKRAQFEAAAGDGRGPKRRLLRPTDTAAPSSRNDVENKSDGKEPDSAGEDGDKKRAVEDGAEPGEPKEEPDDPNTPKFTTTKEKECWIMYKKMSDKGLPVSFDTILRGMLTPTEYRLIRKEITTNS